MATLSDSTGARIGMVRRQSGGRDGVGRQARRPRRRAGSPPGRADRTSRAACRRAARSPAARSPARRTAPAIAAIGWRTAIGIRNVLPIAPRSAFQPNGSAVPSPQMIAGRAAALRRADDRADVAGILHAGQDQDERRIGRRSGGTCVAARPGGSARSRRRPDGCRTGLIAASTWSDTCRTRAPARCACSARSRVVAARPARSAIATSSTGDRASAALPASRCAPSSSTAPSRVRRVRQLAEAAHERILAAGNTFHRGGDCTRSLLPSLARRRPQAHQP